MPDGSMTMEDLIKKRRTEAAKAILRFLMGDDPDMCSVSLKGHLTDMERETLLWLLLSTFPPDQAESIVKEQFKGAGYPLPRLTDDARQEAHWWASNASPAEIAAYAIACFERMSPEWQRRFKEKVNG